MKNYLLLAQAEIETYLCFEAQKYFVKDFFQVFFGRGPASYGVTKIDEIVEYAGRVNRYETANTTKGTILLFVVANVAQRNAPKN